MKLVAVLLDPGLAARDALTAEDSPPDAAGNAVVVASDRDVHQLPPGRCHRGASCRIRKYCTPVS